MKNQSLLLNRLLFLFLLIFFFVQSYSQEKRSILTGKYTVEQLSDWLNAQ